MKRFGLIGRTLQHSFSARYFADKFQREGRSDCQYDLFELTTIERLPSLIQSLPKLVGLNVTIPYKESILPYLSWKQDLVEQAGACNCIHIKEGKLFGYNTDIPAFKSCLQPELKSHHQQALILGTGGASKAVGFVLRSLSIPYKTVSRNAGKDQLTYSALNPEIIRSHPLIINTTPLGTFPDVDSCPPIPYEELSEEHLLFDLVYNPPQTLFLKKGKERGASVQNGYEMLVRQAELSWQIWND